MDIDFKMACSVGRKTYCTNSTLCIVREAIYLHSSYSNCVVYRVVNLFIPLKFFSLPVLISVVHEYSNHGRVALSRGFLIFPNTGMPPPQGLGLKVITSTKAVWFPHCSQYMHHRHTLVSMGDGQILFCGFFPQGDSRSNLTVIFTAKKMG